MYNAVQSDKMYTPQSYLEKMTGKTFVIMGYDDIEFIDTILEQEGISTNESPIWDYPLDEITEAIESETPVVLVDCLVWDEDKSQVEHKYRWFEVVEEK